MFYGDLVLRDFALEYFLGLLHLGDFVPPSLDLRVFIQGDFVLRDYVLGDFVMGDSVPNPPRVNHFQR